MATGIFRKGKRFGTEERFLVIALILYLIYVLFILFSPAFSDWSKGLWDTALSYSQRHGYWGSLIFTFLAHTTIIIPIPYTILLLYLGSTGLSIVLLALAAGFGATLGELSSYLVGLGGGALVWRKYGEHFKALKRIIERRPHMMPWVIFLFGVSPLPDDVLLIPLGMIRYNFFKAVIPMALGKIILAGIFTGTGSLASPFIQSLVEQTDVPWASFVTVFFVIIAVYLVLKVDWQAIGWRLIDKEKGEFDKAE
ncbi:MAG: VTT domain-containing protein [Patescibacteria group bacterium]